MTAEIIPLQCDTFRPMSFALTADKVRSARADVETATRLIVWAQTQREIARRGEMTAPVRLKLMAAAESAGMWGKPEP